MRFGEIQGIIWNRYNEAFNGNMGAIYYLGGAGGQTWEAIRQQFYRETSHASLCHLYSEEDELEKTGSSLDRQLAQELSEQFYQDGIGVLDYSNLSIDSLLNNAKKSVQNAQYIGFDFDIQSALESAFDDLLNVVDRRKS